MKVTLNTKQEHQIFKASELPDVCFAIIVDSDVNSVAQCGYHIGDIVCKIEDHIWPLSSEEYIGYGTGAWDRSGYTFTLLNEGDKLTIEI